MVGWYRTLTAKIGYAVGVFGYDATAFLAIVEP